MMKKIKYSYTDDQVNVNRPQPLPKGNQYQPDWLDYDKLIEWFKSYTICGITYNNGVEKSKKYKEI